MFKLYNDFPLTTFFISILIYKKSLDDVFSYEVQKIIIAPQRQCFAEGCFYLRNFKITGFQRPIGITLKPLAPNLLILNIFSFDVE